MNSSLWYREIMSLKMPNLVHKDLSKILIIFYLIQHDGFNKDIEILDLNRYIYRFYIDNMELAKLHPSIIVNFIDHYSVKDLLPFTKQALEEWKNDFKEGCLKYNESYFKVVINDYNENVLNYTKNIANMQFTKSTNRQFNYDERVEKLVDYNLDFINKTRMKNRVLEDIQYCVCCDDIYNLNIINLSNDIEFINDCNNYITVCDKHYNLYKNGFYQFDDRGKIKIIKEDSLLNSNMHLSIRIMNSNRRVILENKK